MNVAGQEAPQSTGASYIWKAGLFRFFLVMRIDSQHFRLIYHKEFESPPL
ncbi:hypothetical protein LEP1GSC021_4509 [Leptospira noguchii str. 1993005606]|uniref:Uncharacterized protein n=2 Tax=Leptospira noguchii TaxID=28182 RepID=M6YGZ3_9LEPT|nr:hypothetical protein LEP1GSC035_1583 [Leptospira noguchii str. 2007001578]EMO91111.1 hypothetical protein LEP1GSC024_2414 [Leptospira noguchii str. 2001034031]EPE85741.1 hypothetical protein LEP1GSC021_4509 [Leptospira noguchii str. 1993005606]